MIVEIVSTGTELLLGQIVNTNAPYMARRLNEIGFDVLFQSTVGDNRVRMTQVLSTALARADIVITTGGLGPTQGDITKEVSAELLGRPMQLHAPSLENIKRFFASRRLTMPDNNIRQAMFPEGAIVLDNARGTAPGAVIEADGKTVIHLPGPPHEMEHMLENAVIPYLRERFELQGTILSKVLRTFGLGESSLEERIKDYIKNQGNPTIALLARNAEIHVRLTAKASSDAEARALIADLEGRLRAHIGEYIFGEDEDTLEAVVGRHLAAQNLTLALAESCTGGLVSSRLTDVPGSSAYLAGAVVCYSNEVKTSAVGVPAEIIAAHGAVSGETAIAMAEGIRDRFRTDLGIGITGIAGPGGAVPGKPVGLVFIAIAGPSGTKCFGYNLTGPRSFIRHRTALAALNHLRQYVLGVI
ncbi:competence/damage-inducible protein A [Anaeroselena agilis]|uniref:Putative competence-damage inducible protein n=1 Tax=Anaeroselena agilis TaxID=3063788 RepID=A0ABU3NZV2_9FIRM|nr:competence/damage-inducible protein A [Selenomonadales bacterium 4137-cl]